MHLVLKKRRISEQVLLIILVLPIFLLAEFVSVIEFFIFFILLLKNIQLVRKELVPKFIPLFFLMIIGLHGIFENLFYNILKDFWYISKSIPQFTIGFLLMKNIRNINVLFRITIAASLIVSSIHLAGFSYNQELLFMSFREIRNEYERGFTLTVIGLSVIVAMQYYCLPVIQKKIFIPFCLLLLFASLYLSYSRTLWISIVIFLVVFLDTFNKVILRVITVFIFITLVIMIGYLTNMFHYIDTANTLTFTGKIFHSINEIIPKNYFSLSEINQNWRGYESYMALNDLIDSNALIFGKGFGALTDLKIYMFLGDKELRFIPILHNGYVYILSKTGIVGLLIYIYFLFNLLFGIKKNNFIKTYNYHLVCFKLYQGSILVLIFSTFVISGMFNKSACNPLIILSGAFFFFLSQNTFANLQRNSAKSTPSYTRI